MSLKSRACIACYGLGALFTVLSARLIHLGVNQHEHYANVARKNYLAKATLTARRGSIMDAEGAYLAQNEPLKTVAVDGTMIKDPMKVADLLAGPLQMKTADLLERINPGRQFIVLKKKVSEEVAEKLEKSVREAGIKGVIFEQDFERIYPAHQMLCHVIGFHGYEETDAATRKGSFHGIEGIERSMDNWLAGQDGWRYFEKDGRGRELMNYTGEERAPRNGANVRLTVNLNLQQIVESELEAACKRLRPQKATVIMMKPDTGEILALANRPTFDPNEPGKAKPEDRFNFAVAGIYEPGSTFKAVTCAGALNYQLVTPNTEIWCENGTWMYGGKPLRDHRPYGMLSVSQIIEKSSNIGAAKLAVQLGDERFHSWVRAFGFGQQTGIALPGEVRGIVHPLSKWTGISITRVAMGHEVSATPMQVMSATCAIANGGRLLMPQIIRDIRDEAGKVLVEYAPQEVRRVISESTAGKVRDALIRVTGRQGTAKLAHIPGYHVAGKTGTAQKLEDGRYSHEHHITSFIGFVPAEKPAFCLLVIFDQAKVPSHEDVGGLVAAPVFRTIAERTLSHLGIRPDPVLLQQDKEQKIILAKAGQN